MVRLVGCRLQPSEPCGSYVLTPAGDQGASELSKDTSVSAAGGNRDRALKALYDDIHSRNLFPFWATSTEVEHDEVRQLLATKKAVPFRWSYRDDLEPLLYRSADLVNMSDSERRSLILVNPGLAPQRATVSTMYTAYRLNDPNEIMPPHRHSPSAIRFGLIGSRNFTGVEGEDITFGPGDMVLTPHDTWHNHGNAGDEPAINLSVLDLPLVETLNAIYFEHDYKEMENGKLVSKKVQSARVPSDYSARVYAQGGLLPRFVSHQRGTGDASPMYLYRWDAMRDALDRHKDHDGDPYEALMIEYVDPTTGASIFRTMTFFAQMLRPGEKTRPLQQTASLLVAPFQGSGHSIVDGQRFNWERFDTLAVPGGSWCEHVNGSDREPAILFVASDEPALKAFGLYKKWGRESGGDTVLIL
jgi:gentisate 1,2-dioxygenase